MSDLKERILDAVRADFESIEIALTHNLHPHFDLVAKTARHILFAGGKRLRPLLMVQSARICGYSGDYDKTLATIFEYLHAATLLHDDLVDGAVRRRGKPVAHAVFGNETAVLTGDFLLARSLSIAAQTERMEIIRIVAEITEHMSQGEINQLAQKGNLGLSETEYLEVIRYKTAMLIQGACHVGAIIADAPKQLESAMTDYGYHLGMAFQMADDLLDYTADSQTLGKEIGADLREGKLTLPLIHALARADAPDKAAMRQMIGTAKLSAGQFGRFIELLNRYGGVAYVRERAAGHLQKAHAALSVFPDSKTRTVLGDIAEYALARKV